MKLVTVEDLKDGDIIANDVLLEDYTVVLAKGTVIKAPYIDKLRELDIFTVYIEDEQELTAKPEEPKPEPPKSPKAEAPKEPKPSKAPAPKKPVAPVSPKPEANKQSKIPMEKVTILRDEVEEQVKNKIKDILELHVYQQTEGLQQIAEIGRAHV